MRPCGGPCPDHPHCTCGAKAHRVNGHAKKPELPAGGNCDLCGEWAGTLTAGVCLACVAFYRLA